MISQRDNPTFTTVAGLAGKGAPERERPAVITSQFIRMLSSLGNEICLSLSREIDPRFSSIRIPQAATASNKLQTWTKFRDCICKIFIQREPQGLTGTVR